MVPATGRKMGDSQIAELASMPSSGAESRGGEPHKETPEEGDCRQYQLLDLMSPDGTHSWSPLDN
jgi:hypothetical protein